MQIFSTEFVQICTILREIKQKSLTAKKAFSSNVISPAADQTKNTFSHEQFYL